jgi:lipoate---protein ligase
MRYLELTLPGAAENLALDEALLEQAEAGGKPLETLRLWEPIAPMVVLGRSSRIDVEVHGETCRELGIPVLRRISGGATIVTGPGCLMYALILSCERRPRLRSLSQAHHDVLEMLTGALRPLVGDVESRGTCDLTLGPLKFSGNSVRCRRGHLLYHGTLLYDFPLELVERCLAMPPRMPDYRAKRPHGRFVTNLPLTADAIRRSLVAGCDAHEPCIDWPHEATTKLVAEKYSRPEWNNAGR